MAVKKITIAGAGTMGRANASKLKILLILSMIYLDFV